MTETWMFQAKKDQTKMQCPTVMNTVELRGFHFCAIFGSTRSISYDKQGDSEQKAEKQKTQSRVSHPRDPGSPNLRMVSWNLNTTCVSFR